MTHPQTLQTPELYLGVPLEIWGSEGSTTGHLEPKWWWPPFPPFTQNPGVATDWLPDSCTSNRSAYTLMMLPASKNLPWKAEEACVTDPHTHQLVHLMSTPRAPSSLPTAFSSAFHLTQEVHLGSPCQQLSGGLAYGEQQQRGKEERGRGPETDSQKCCPCRGVAR